MIHPYDKTRQRPALKKKIAELEKSVDDLKKALAAVIKAQEYAARAANAALYIVNYGGRR